MKKVNISKHFLVYMCLMVWSGQVQHKWRREIVSMKCKKLTLLSINMGCIHISAILPLYLRVLHLEWQNQFK
jgi:hypothetical protein